MPERPLSFRVLRDPAEAEDLADLLRTEGLPATVAENSAVFDVTFTAGVEREYHVMLPGHLFQQAESLLEEHQRQHLPPLSGDHYLHGFSDEELLEVLRESHAWSAFDRIHAERLLALRGVRTVPDALAATRRARLDELAEPEEAHAGWLLAGIIMVLFGGLGGMVIGWSLLSARKVLPDGRSVPRYGPRDRRRGRAIMLAGAVVLLATLVYFFHTLG
jgi:hypothetical protein